MASSPAPYGVDTSPDGIEDPGIDLFGLIRRYFLLIALLAGVGAILGLLYSQRVPAVYSSDARILIVKRQKSVLQEGQVSEIPLAHSVVIGSPQVLAKAVDLGDLSRLPGLSSTPTDSLARGLRVFSRSEQVGDLPSSSQVLDLSFQSSQASTCPTALNAIVDAYRDFLGETYASDRKEVLAYISRAKDELAEQIEQRQAQYRRFLEDSPLVWEAGEAGDNMHVKRLAQIEAKRSELMLERNELESELTTIQQLLGQDIPAGNLLMMIGQSFIGEDGQLARSGPSALDELRLQEKLLLEDFGPDHPRVRTVRTRIAVFEKLQNLDKQGIETAEDQQRAIIDAYLESRRQRLAVIGQQLEAYDSLFEKEREAAKRLATYENQKLEMLDSIERTSRLFDAVVKRLEEISFLKDDQGYAIQVLSHPSAGVQVEPNIPRFIGIGAVVGALAGFALGFLLERADTRFRGPDEVAQQVRAPVVGHIPLLRAKNVDDSELDKSLVAFHRPHSRSAEAFRVLRTALLYGQYGAPGTRCRVIQLTSPSPGDGKTTLATNLAIMLAQAKKSVLLIDADLRLPKVHKLFRREPEQGLTQVLQEKCEVPDTILDTPVAHLSLLPCGSRPSNPAELLTSPRFRELMEMLREQYDFIVVDTPPILAVTDPCSVATEVDALLMAVRLGKHSRDMVVRAAEILSSVNASIHGVVINGVDPAKSSSMYARYRDGYGYGSKHGYPYAHGRYGDYHKRYNSETAAIHDAEVAASRTEANGHAHAADKG